jgi:hypothetical protein
MFDILIFKDVIGITGSQEIILSDSPEQLGLSAGGNFFINLYKAAGKGEKNFKVIHIKKI